MSRDTGLDTLLDLDGSIIDQEDGYWVKLRSRKQTHLPKSDLMELSTR